MREHTWRVVSRRAWPLFHKLREAGREPRRGPPPERAGSRFARLTAGPFHSAAWCVGAVLLASGARANAQSGWTLRTPAATPPAGEAAMVYDSARGVSVACLAVDTWEWDGNNWLKRTPANSPTGPRSLSFLAYDSARHVTVLFGGSTGAGYQNDTWEWDGTNWTERNPATAPSTRVDGAMAYDGVRGVTVLFGGVHAGAALGDTWEWDGTNWTQRLPAVSPSPREAPAMVFDSARGVTMLFGGSGTNALADTWEWDGTNWSEKSPTASPPARFACGMAYDSRKQAALLFGGYVNGTYLGDTWEWDGTNWTQRSPATAPSARTRCGMAFDSARIVTVLFGGAAVGGTLSSETWEWSCQDDSITQQPANQGLAAGQTAVFSVTASGPGPFSYRWRKNGVVLADGGSVSGSSTATLTINPVAPADSGSYACGVTGACAEIFSQAAVLFVDPCRTTDPTLDCNGNGILDSCEISANPALDADSNGILDSCETPPAQQAAPCGLCGPGTTAMMPLSLMVWSTIRARSSRMPRRRSPGAD